MPIWRVLLDFAAAVNLALVIRRVLRMGNLREAIKAADDMNSEMIDVPEWGVIIEVRTMTSKARSRMLRQSMTDDNVLDFEILYPAVLLACCFDPEDSTPVFTSDDMSWLNDKSAGPIEKLAQAGMRLSGLTREAVEAGKGVS